MFKEALSPKFSHVVEAEIAGEAEKKTVKFTGVFLRATQSEVDQAVKSATGDEQLVRERLVGWKGFEGWSGITSDPEFTPENLEDLLAIDGMRAVIARAFLQGNSTATRKN